MRDPTFSPSMVASAIIFSVIFLTGIAIITLHEITQPPHHNAITTIVQIMLKGQAAAIIAGASAITYETGAYIVILAAYVINKQREKAVAEGVAKGQNNAYQRANAEFAAYLERMRAAQDAGEPFTEPPPYFPTNHNE